MIRLQLLSMNLNPGDCGAHGPDGSADPGGPGQDEVPAGLSEGESAAAAGGVRHGAADPGEGAAIPGLQVDMVLGGYHIPSGTKVVRAGMITSVSSEHFTDPESFVPERWLRADPKYNTANSFANLPWGHGPRQVPSPATPAGPASGRGLPSWSST